MRESFIFYKTFYDCIKELPKDSGYSLYHAIFEYVFFGEEPNLSGLEKGIFALMKVQIDANNKKYENGKLGGRPKNENQEETNGLRKAHENENQKKTLGFEKAHENENQNETKTKPNVNVNDNVNGNENDDVNENENGTASRYENTHTRGTRFDTFWKSYPRKNNMLNAQAEYMHLLETTRSLSEEDLIAAAQNYAETCQIRNTKEQYIKNPVNWLKESIWIDFLPENYKKPDIVERKIENNRFNNISARKYDYKELEKALLERPGN